MVGGGLAGLSAAYGLAAAGVEVMVLERGDYPGAKNVTGGRLYLSPIRELYPELWPEAPIERPVARELATFTAGDAATTVEIASRAFVGAQPQSGTVLRARLDQWLGEKVTEKGAMLVPGMKVDELLRSEGPRGGHPRRRGQHRRRCGGGGRGRAAACSAPRPAWPRSRSRVTTPWATRRSSSCPPASSRTAGAWSRARARRSSSWAT